MAEVAYPWNTPDRREEVINTEPRMQDFTLSTWGAVPTPVLDWLTDLLNGSTDLRGLLLYGPAGSGKTGLGFSVLKAIARHGLGSLYQWNQFTGQGVQDALKTELLDYLEILPPVWFQTWHAMAELFRENKDISFRSIQSQTAVIMLDDLDSDHFTAWRQSLLLRFLDGRVPLILTLNAPPEKWNGLFGERIADRLASQQRFVTVDVSGASRR